MDRYEEVRMAILERLKELGVQPHQPVSMYELGTALVPTFTEHEIVDGVIALHDRRVIEVMHGNRIQLLS